VNDRPVRWLSGGDATAEERALVASAPAAEPPAGAEDRIWALLAPKLPPGDGGGGGGSAGDLGAGGTLGTTATLGALKAAGVGALAGLLVAGAATLATGTAPPAARPLATTTAIAPAIEPPAPAARPAEAPATPSRDEIGPFPTARASRPPAPEPVAPQSSVGALAVPPEARADQLREESRALQAVRDALRRGDAAGALATLEATRARFPASVLGQEREALAIQALAAAGQPATARARARAFLAQFPASPHAPALRRFAEP
jgi:hypothetical protein